MPINIKKAQADALAEFGDDYLAPDEAGNLPKPIPGLKVRLVDPKKTSYWANHGLRPIKAGSHLIVNEDQMSKAADNTLRFGKLEIWGETEGHYENRAGHLRTVRREQTSIVEAFQSLTEEAKAIGAEVMSKDAGKPGIQTHSGPIDGGIISSSDDGALEELRRQNALLQEQNTALQQSSGGPTALDLAAALPVDLASLTAKNPAPLK